MKLGTGRENVPPLQSWQLSSLAGVFLTVKVGISLNIHQLGTGLVEGLSPGAEEVDGGGRASGTGYTEGLPARHRAQGEGLAMRQLGAGGGAARLRKPVLGAEPLKHVAGGARP